MTLTTQNMKKANSKKSENEWGATEQTKIVKPIDQYISLGLNALDQWKPGKINSKQPIAQVIDMFCGGGGMSLGFAAIAQATGAFRLIGGVDINEVSLRTYEHNYGIPAQKIDVRELANSNKSLNKFLASLPEYDQKLPTILIGCAPCQGFTAHRKKNWDEPDIRNGLAFAGLLTVFQTPQMVFPMAIVADIVDYDTLRSCRNRAGSYFSIRSLCHMGVSAVGSALGFYVLALVGYDPKTSANTAAATLGMQIDLLVLPGVFFVVAAAILFRFPIDARRHAVIRRRLDRRAARIARDTRGAIGI